VLLSGGGAGPRTALAFLLPLLALVAVVLVVVGLVRVWLRVRRTAIR